ncbi:hypothetical protein E2C01_060918 [Portunus trituberculatus]|uniref:Uncharacterized protein n=1 Tax=Portunus trituberculatus TaxID=210409 RepID=A0A5B7HAX6_PORTR|nr:hypothetical protein [Portunus trituberculatus]
MTSRVCRDSQQRPLSNRRAITKQRHESSKTMISAQPRPTLVRTCIEAAQTTNSVKMNIFPKENKRKAAQSNDAIKG